MLGSRILPSVEGGEVLLIHVRSSLSAEAPKKILHEQHLEGDRRSVYITASYVYQQLAFKHLFTEVTFALQSEPAKVRSSPTFLAGTLDPKYHLNYFQV